MLHQGNESVAKRIRLGKNTADNPSSAGPVNQLVEKGVFLPSPVNADEGHKKSTNCPTLRNRFCLMGCH